MGCTKASKESTEGLPLRRGTDRHRLAQAAQLQRLDGLVQSFQEQPNPATLGPWAGVHPRLLGEHPGLPAMNEVPGPEGQAPTQTPKE